MSTMAGETAAAPAQAPGSRQAGLPRFAKRTLDVTLGTIILVLASPLLVVTAGAILLDSGRPVFFRGTRIGRGGRPFTMMKFRSMIVGAYRSGGLADRAVDAVLQNLFDLLGAHSS